jgi:outer membrane protein assembly factor BamB
LYAIDAQTGSQKWVFRTTGSVRSHPVVVKTSATDPGTIIFGSDDDTLYAIDTKGDPVWKYTDSRDDIASALVYSPEDGLVFFLGSDFMVQAVNVATGKRKWQMRLPASRLNISPVLHDQRLYIPAGTSIYAYRLRTGTPTVHSFMGPDKSVEADISTTPIVADDPGNVTSTNAGLFYFGDHNGNFYCATFKGDRRWKTRLDARATSMPVLAGEVLYVGTEKGFVYGLNAKDGSILWSYRAEAPRDYQVQYSYHNVSAPLVADAGQLLVLGDDGSLTCFTADAIDANPPVISTPKPDRGTVLNGTPPLTMSVYVWDKGSGINPATVAVFVDNTQAELAPEPYYTRGSGIRWGVTYNPMKRTVEYTTKSGTAGERVSPLNNGPHTVRVQAADWKGNLSTMEWRFMVDNSLPIRKTRAPATTPNRPAGTPGYGGYGAQPGVPGAFPGAPGGYNPQQPRAPRGRGPAGRRR